MPAPDDVPTAPTPGAMGEADAARREPVAEPL
jgi:hypothetical protein